MQKIVPFLWFDGQAEQAMKYYVSVFKNARVESVHRQGKKVFSVSFVLEGQSFIALNGGPAYKFSPAISLFVDCKTQKEVDRLWDKLSKGGEKQRCGWLTDKFGVTWQIIPTQLGELLQDESPERASRVMSAMLGMTKIDVQALQAAARGPSARASAGDAKGKKSKRKTEGKKGKRKSSPPARRGKKAPRRGAASR